MRGRFCLLNAKSNMTALVSVCVAMLFGTRV